MITKMERKDLGDVIKTKNEIYSVRARVSPPGGPTLYRRYRYVRTVLVPGTGTVEMERTVHRLLDVIKRLHIPREVGRLYHSRNWKAISLAKLEEKK